MICLVLSTAFPERMNAERSIELELGFPGMNQEFPANVFHHMPWIPCAPGLLTSPPFGHHIAITLPSEQYIRYTFQGLQLVSIGQAADSLHVPSISLTKQLFRVQFTFLNMEIAHLEVW